MREIVTRGSVRYKRRLLVDGPPVTSSVGRGRFSFLLLLLGMNIVCAFFFFFFVEEEDRFLDGDTRRAGGGRGGRLSGAGRFCLGGEGAPSESLGTFVVVMPLVLSVW